LCSPLFVTFSLTKHTSVKSD